MTAGVEPALRSLARRTDPADAGAQNNLGVLLLARGLRDDAAAAFARALELDPQMQVARENFGAAADPAWRARRAAELGARLRADGTDAEARRELARLAASLGRFDEARAELDALVALRPRDAGALVLRALCEQAAGDLDSAAEWLERALVEEPRSAVALTHLGQVYYHRGEPARALATLDRALAAAPDHADAHHVRGFVLGELGRHDDAAESTHRALALNPALGRAHANLSAPGEHRAAPVIAAREARRETPVSAEVEVHVALGVAFRQKAYYDEALREYRRALARGADEAPTVRAMAELQLLRGAAAEALPLWARLCELEPADAEAWNGRGVAAHLSGDAVAALAAYERAVAVAYPGDAAAAWAHNNGGVARAAAGDGPAAAAAFARAVAAEPTLLAARLNLAQTLAAAGDAGRALAEYREALRSEPTNADAWGGVGGVLAAAGRHAEARTAYARAVEADPSRADARYRMAFEAAALGDHDAARREVERALAVMPYVDARPLALAIDLGQPVALAVSVDVQPDARVDGFHVAPGAIDALLHETLVPDSSASETATASPYAVAEECLRAGLYDRAAADVSRALARGADRAEGLAILGDAFARQGYFGEALERYRESREGDPASRRAAVGEVRMLREMGRRLAAWEAAEAAAGRWPGDAECLALVAALRVDAGDADGERSVPDALARASALADDPGVWLVIAGAWRALGDNHAAAAACRRALALEPGRGDLRLALARALASAGDLAPAAAELRAALADAPSFLEARLELAAVVRARGDARDAAAELVALLERDPHHLDALAALGELLADAGRVGDARVAVSRVLRLDAEHARALAVEGDLLAAEGRGEDACRRWERALALEPVGDAARRARARLHAGAMSAALPALEAAP